MAWVERNTIDLSLNHLLFSNEENIKVFDFSRLRVTLPGKKYPYDFGVLCFGERKRKSPHPGRKDFTIWLHKQETLHAERIKVVQRFSEFIYSLHRLGKRCRTLENYINTFISFVQWCDQNYPSVFLTETKVRDAYSLYNQALLEEIRKNKLHVNSAALKNRLIIVILSAIFEDNKGQLTSGIKRIRANSFAANVTAPPTETIAQNAILLFTHLFIGTSNFVLKSEPYPFKLKLPDEMVWLFPGHIAFATQLSLAKRHEWREGLWGWDYANGVIADYKTITHHYKKPDSAYRAIENAKNILDYANLDYRHSARLALCSLAIQCFTMLFIANTAMNIAPLSQLEWETNNDFESSKDMRQGFRTIKHRAGNALVEFHITNHFFPYFQQYIKLRQWILQGVKAPLFFTLDKQQMPKKINDTLAFKLRKKLEKFEIKIPSAREWRAYKSDWLIRTTDVATASLLLQNSEETILRHYAGGSKIRADQEMTTFLKKLHEKVVKPETISTLDISVGQCREHNVPESEIHHDSIQPDCYQPEGCLFCTKYYVHADDQDIRKLYSCLYVITESRVIADSEIHFNKVFGAVIKRITFLLDAISMKSDVLKHKVEKIRREVTEEEKLTNYWASKLQMLVELEMV